MFSNIASTLTYVKVNDAEEYIDGVFQGKLGEILIRCNNVLYIRGVSENEKDDENASK